MRTDIKQGDIITPIPFDGPNKDYYEVTSVDVDSNEFWVVPAGQARYVEPMLWELGRFRYVQNSGYLEPGTLRDENGNPLAEGGQNRTDSQ